MITFPTPYADIIEGTPNHDIITGFDGDDSLFGFEGNDLFFAGIARWIGPDLVEDGSVVPYLLFGQVYDFGRGNGRYFGGSGTDTVSYEGVTTSISINLAIGEVQKSGETDLLSSIEQIISGDGNDIVVSATKNSRIYLEGGNDQVFRFANKAFFDGGDGLDQLNFKSLSTSLNIDLAKGRGSYVGAEKVTLLGFEDVYGARKFENTIIGNNVANVLHGGSRFDEIRSGGGDDRINSFGGDDILFGGDGNDRIRAGDGDDIIHGDAGNDYIDGGDGTNLLFGGDGNDFIKSHLGVSRGGAGDDRISHYKGELYGEEGNDILKVVLRGHLSGGEGDDSLFMTYGKGGGLFGDEGNDSLFVLENPDPFPRGGTTYLYGGSGYDTLYFSGSQLSIVEKLYKISSSNSTFAAGIEKFVFRGPQVSVAIEFGSYSFKFSTGNDSARVLTEIVANTGYVRFM
jgi:Ca2+-binding RTX toxin-like protein